MLKELENDRSWRYVFEYAGTPAEPDYWVTNAKGDGVVVLRCVNATCSTDPFGREDVVRIIGTVEGEPDTKDWEIAGQLRDGRWFYLSAGCDYTGWG